MTNAAITPGIHPQSVNIHTNNIDPHPLSKTVKGGKIIAKSTRPKLMTKYFYIVQISAFFW
ncbi:hypothetical protein AV926_00360 [Myroides marinus]|uniref:Uncharacterized protein n=1 Tax=Myroides marinus TaxID=703342 RepID=A0A161SLP4_9FLAO|nr:hypothetical protein AS361_07615 [Myroides marinus]KZE83406.1 hypothetical protein AV926_00360 [Myroides marinus]